MYVFYSVKWRFSCVWVYCSLPVGVGIHIHTHQLVRTPFHGNKGNGSSYGHHTFHLPLHESCRAEGGRIYCPDYDMFIAGLRARGRARITLPLPLSTEIVLYKRQALKGGGVQPPVFGVVTFHVPYSSLLETGGKIGRVHSR